MHEKRLIVNVSLSHLEQALVPAMEPLLRTMGILKPSDKISEISLQQFIALGYIDGEEGQPVILPVEVVLEEPEVKTYNINGKEQ